MATVFRNGRVLVDGRLQEGLCVVVEHGRIQAVGPDTPDGDAVDLQAGILAPGFIDTQVNGGGNVLFNDAPTV
ncbi:MAG TPA: N-acetylglucosamine-6-phosphate deacetylase, partial [Sphingomonas sp.]|nr:N-acetylglucosamine-6-phosphate deacetylase [Sphingomonas sp.]